MDSVRKEEIIQEIEKEEKICKDIYEEILRNRIRYEEEIRLLQQEKLSINLSNPRFKSTTNSATRSTFHPPKPRKDLYLKNDENAMSIKELKSSQEIQTHKHHDMRIPLSFIQPNHNFDAISSRKNPLDSLRNTTDRNLTLGSFDSLQYSEDLSFL